MKIGLEIPKEFEEHFNNDRFRDSMERIRCDLDSRETFRISGLYERELVTMLLKAFQEASA